MLLEYLKMLSTASANNTAAAAGDDGSGTATGDPNRGKVLAHFDSANTTVNSNVNESYVDESDNSHTITVSGDPLSTTFNPYYPPIGYRSCEFDGTGDYITVAGSSDLAFGTGDFTIEFFLKTRIVPTSSDYDDVFTNPSGLQIYFVGGKLRYNHNGTGSLLDTTSSVVADRWTHYALVRNSGTTKWYVDGTAEGSYSDSKNWTATSNWFIGSSDGSTQYFNGWISNLRVLKGSAKYTSDFTVPTEPLTDITYTSLLACQSNSFKDTSSKNTTLTQAGDVSISSYYPNTFQLTTEYSKTSHGGSAYFNADYLYIPATSTLSLVNATDFTIELWFYTETSKASRSEHLWGSAVDGSNRESIYFNGATLTWWVNGAAKITTTAYQLYQWNHIAIVNNSGTTTFYLNGVSVGTYTSAYTAGNRYAWIGTYNNNTHTPDGFIGYIANVRMVNGTAVYTSSFTPPTSLLTKITNTAYLPKTNMGLVEKTAKKLDLTYYGNTEVSGFAKHLRYASTLDGTGDWIQAPSGAYKEFGSGDFTIEAWVKPASVSGAINYIVTAGSGTSTHFNFALQLTTKLRLWLSSNGSTWNLITSDTTQGQGSTTVTAGKIYHVAMVRDGTNVKGYLNGNLEVTVDVGTNSVVSQSSENLNIGKSAYQGAYGYFNGQIYAVRVVKGTAVYTSAFTPPTTALTAITNTGLLLSSSSATVTDTSTNSHTLTVNGDTSSTREIDTREGVSFDPGSTLTFAGSGDYLTVTDDHQLLNLDSDDFTIEFWFRRNAVNDSTYGDTFICNATGVRAIALAINPSGYTGVSYSTSAGAWAKVGTDPGNTFGSIQVETGKWYHYAVVRDGSNGYQFVNGVKAETFSFSGTLTDWNGGMHFSHWHDGYTRNFNGEIFDFRMTKGVARYTQNYTIPTSRLFAKHGSASGTGTTLATDAFFANTVFLQSSNTTPANTTINNNESYTDDSGNQTISRHTGTIYTSSFSPYIPESDWSIRYDGSDDYFYYQSSSVIPPPVAWLDGASDDGTFECNIWLNGAQASPSQDYTWAAMFNLGSTYMNFGIDNSGNIRYYYWTGSGNNFNGSSTLEPYRWYHLALVREATTLKIYIDGQLDATKTSYAGITWASGSEGEYLYHGVGHNTAHADAFFKGNVTNIRYSDSARYTSNFTPPTDIFTSDSNTIMLINGKKLEDKSSNDYSLTRASDTTSPHIKAFSPFASDTHFTPNTGSVRTDDSSAYLKVVGGRTDLKFGTGDFTVEGWMYIESLGSTGYAGLVETRSGVNTEHWVIGIFGNKLDWFYGSGRFQSTATLFPGEWYHIAVSKSGDTMKGFVDGVERFSEDASTHDYDTSTGTADPVLGRIWDTNGYFVGHYTDLRVVKGTGVYTSAFTAPTSPLTNVTNTTLLMNNKNYGYYDQANHVMLESSDETKANAWPWGRHIKYASYHPDSTSGFYTVAETGSDEFTFGTGNVTMECFFMPIANPSSQPYSDAGIMSTAHGSDTHGVFIAQYGNTGLHMLVGAGAGSWPVNATAASVLTYGRWHHIAYCREGNVHRLYCNGAKVAEVTNSVSATNTNNLLAIGGRTVPGASQHPNGYIGDVRVVKGTAVYTAATITPPFSGLTAITNTVFLQSTDSATLEDTSASPLTITQGGGIGTYTNFKSVLTVASTPISFDGSSYINLEEEADDYIGKFGTQDFTIEAYVWRHATGSVGSWLASDHSSGFDSGAIFFRFGSGATSPSGNNNGKFHVGWHGVGDSFIQTTNTYADRTWHHYALVRSGNNFAQYVNGSRDGTATSSNEFNLDVSDGIRLGHSTWDGGNGYFNGMIAQLRITVGNARYSGYGFSIPDNYLPAKKP